MSKPLTVDCEIPALVLRVGSLSLKTLVLFYGEPTDNPKRPHGQQRISHGQPWKPSFLFEKGTSFRALHLVFGTLGTT